MNTELLDTHALNVQKIRTNLYLFEWRKPKSRDEAINIFSMALGCLKTDLAHNELTEFYIIVDDSKVQYETIKRILSYSFYKSCTDLIKISQLRPQKIVTILPKNDLLTKVGLSISYEDLNLNKDFVYSLSEAFELLGINEEGKSFDILGMIRDFVDSETEKNGLTNYEILSQWARLQDLEVSYSKGLISFDDYSLEKTKVFTFFSKQLSRKENE